MFKKLLISVVFGLFISQAVFAHYKTMGDSDEPRSKHCEMIAKACKNAGYERRAGKGKSFWFGCMKPILSNHSVKGVHVNKKEVRACRDFKIKHLEKKLDELKKYQNQ